MSAHPSCPCCEGSGLVPSASGMTDVECLCQTLSGLDRVILRGRAATLAVWEAEQEHLQSAFLAEQISHKRATMVHLVAGCVGPCRGNSAAPGEARCMLGPSFTHEHDLADACGPTCPPLPFMFT